MYHLLFRELAQPRYTLFPYTTLFRSRRTPRRRGSLSFVPPAHHPPPGARDAGPERPIARRCLRRSEEHTSELQSRRDLVCRLLLEKKNKNKARYQADDKLLHMPKILM